MVKRLLGALVIVAMLGCKGDFISPSPVPSDPVVEAPPVVIVEPPVVMLPPLTVVGTEFWAGGQKFVWAGVTAFDAPQRLVEGDTSYIDWAAQEGFTLVRVVPASVYRTPRTLEDGIAAIGPFLTAAAERGLYVEVVVGVDTAMYGLSESAFKAYAQDIAKVVNLHSNAVVEMVNEINHHTHQEYVGDEGLHRVLLSFFVMPGSAGSSHGGAVAQWAAGEYLTHHSDRRLTPQENASHMAAAQARFGKPVVDDEALGIGPVARAGSRTNDPQYALQQAQMYHRYGLGGVTLHLDMGLDARLVNDNVQFEAAQLFVQEMKNGRD